MGIVDIEILAKKYYPKSIDSKTIAMELGINRRTVTTQIKKVFEKPSRCKNLQIEKIGFRNEFVVTYNNTYTQ